MATWDSYTCLTCGHNFSRRTVPSMPTPRYCTKKCSANRDSHLKPAPIPKIPKQKVDYESRFWSKVDIRGRDECWPYKAGTHEFGYGVFWMDGKQQNAHVIAFEFENGSIPVEDGRRVHLVRHSCDNPPCCNPRHLIAGTTLDNVRDKISRKRCSPLSGARKLNDAAVRAIRESDLSNRELGRAYGVNEGTIRHIRIGNTWKHLL